MPPNAEMLVSKSGIVYFHDLENDYYTVEHPLTQRYLKARAGGKSHGRGTSLALPSRISFYPADGLRIAIGNRRRGGGYPV